MYTAQKEELLATELFDALPESVLWFMPVWSDEGNGPRSIVDFQVHYCNDAACTFLKAPKENIIGNTVRSNRLVDQHYNQVLFEQCRTVWETGTPHEESFYNEHLGRYFSALRSKVMGGVVSITRDRTEAYKAEREREQQSELLHSILDTSINGIFACEAIRDEAGEIVDLRFLKINKPFTQMTGKAEADIIGKTYLSLFPTAKQTGLFALNCQVINTGQPARKEVFYQGEGLNAWYEISLAKLGKDGLVVTFADITENKKNKSELEQYSSRLQTIINTSHSGIFTGMPLFDSQGEVVDFRFTSANRALAAYVGQTPEVIVGTKGSEWFPGYQENGLFNLFKQTYLTGNSLRFDFHYDRDGIDAWIDMMSTKMGEEVLVNFTDFTALKLLQEEAEKLATRLNTVINTSQVGVFTLSPVRNEGGAIVDFRFGIVNPAVAAYIGQTPEVLRGDLGSRWFPAYMTNGLFEIYVDTLENNQTHHFNFHYGDGYDVYFDILSIKMGDEVLVTFTDHTAIKKLQLQLEASVDELKRSNANLEEFAYAASHDLQEPLRKISFFSGRLKETVGGKLTEEETRMFDRMESATERMRNLIEDLLTYARTSMHPEDFEAVELNEVIEEVTKDMEASIVQKGALLQAATLPTVRGNKRQLRQLFQNLLSNSLKYSKEDVAPVITLSATLVQEHLCGVHLPEEDAKRLYHRIVVEDNGIGFEQQDAERIFNVFQRLHGRSDYSGTGVGLAIVRKVVENHHGCISAEGETGKGSRFIILLPAE